MSGKAEKLQWHPAFCAATELELRQDLDVLELIPEYNLSKKPLQIDLVIIKKMDWKRTLQNEIGHIMRGHNILEYKGPGDELTIDSFFKVIGYASLYKAQGIAVNKIPASEVTVSFFRNAYPKALFQELKKEGYILKNVSWNLLCKRKSSVPSTSCSNKSVGKKSSLQPAGIDYTGRDAGCRTIFGTDTLFGK